MRRIRHCLLLALGLAAAAPAPAALVPVSDVAGLRAALQAAAPGHDIVLAPGTYAIDGNLSCSASGTGVNGSGMLTCAPIAVRTVTKRTAAMREPAANSPRSATVVRRVVLTGEAMVSEDLTVCARH